MFFDETWGIEYLNYKLYYYYFAVFIIVTFGAARGLK